MPEPNVRKLSRKERERQAHRREILQAAERVMVQKGYHLATVEEIAQQAEFAVGTIYNFFKSKADLYNHVVEGIAREFMDAFQRRVLTRADAGEGIAGLIELRLTHFEDHRGFFRVFFETSPGGRADPALVLPPNVVDLYDQYIEQVTGLFAEYVKGGPLEGADPLYVALAFEAIINAFVAYWSRREPSEPLGVRVAKMKQALLGWFRRGYFEHQAD